jgi:hypothetical protein
LSSISCLVGVDKTVARGVTVDKYVSAARLLMRFTSTRWLASTLAITATALSAALAGDQTEAGRGHVSDRAVERPEESKVLTGKERLGNKWMDEQRVDNCKVPVDKRGTRPRPDTCSHAPAE